jgi:hypothetical protein
MVIFDGDAQEPTGSEQEFLRQVVSMVRARLPGS